MSVVEVTYSWSGGEYAYHLVQVVLAVYCAVLYCTREMHPYTDIIQTASIPASHHLQTAISQQNHRLLTPRRRR